MKSIKLLFFATVLLLIGCKNISADKSSESFEADFNNLNNRIWIGQDFWAVPMEDWKIENGRIECIDDRGESRVNILTQNLIGDGTLTMSVKIGSLKPDIQNGSAGFTLGLQDETDNDIRSLCYFGKGIPVGFNLNNSIYIGDESADLPNGFEFESVKLSLRAKRTSTENWTELTVTDKNGLSETLKSDKNFPLTGICTLANNHVGKSKGKKANFWFDDIAISGSMVESKPENSFGPLLWSMYTLSKKELKLSVQMPPISIDDAQSVHFQLKSNNNWETVSTVNMDKNARNATFKIASWDDSKDHAYRLVYTERFKDNSTKDNYFTGTIQQDPKEKKLEMAAMTCQYHYGFPYRPLSEGIAKKNPDILFFSGDQIYEPNGGYGIIRFPADRAILSYLGKWYMFGWAFGDLMKDRPTICLADDHEVFQGNLWGNGGKKVSGADWRKSRDATSGYVEPVEMVNVVIRTNSAHHPEPFDPTPVEQGMDVFYTDISYGGVSFAMVSDRMFKSGPDEVAETTKKAGFWKGRKDMLHSNYPKSSIKKEQSLKLMGDRQLKFLNHWMRDWKDVSMKVLLSQTIFANNVTHYGRTKVVLKSDLDSGGWPKYGRDKVVDLMRRCFAFQICGDQHLPSMVQYGIEDYKDANWAFCTPAVSVGYPRRFMPDTLNAPYVGRPAHNAPNTGLYQDGFGNKNFVYAVGNPDDIEKHENRYQMAQNKASGFGYITFDQKNRDITSNSYRFLSKEDDEKGRGEFEGWPKTINQLENFNNGKNKLPELSIQGLENAVVEVINEATKQMEHIVRINGNNYQPSVKWAGNYTVRIFNPENKKEQVLSNLKAKKDNNKIIKVTF